MPIRVRAPIVAAALLAACGATAFTGCGERVDPVTRLLRARPAYGEDPAEFVRLGKSLLAESQDPSSLEGLIAEAAAYEFRVSYWRRLGPEASRGDVAILAALAAQLPRNGAAGWSPRGPLWLKRIRALYGKADWFLSIEGAPAEGIQIACLLGRVPVFDADVLPRLTVAQERKATGEKTYRGGGGGTTLTRYRYELRGELRLPDGRTQAIATSAQDPELPDVAEFSSWKSDTGITSLGGEARGYRRASADTVVAAAESMRSALSTKLAPLPAAGAGPSEHPTLWEVAAGLLTACPDHGVAPCSDLRALRTAIIEVPASDAKLPVVDELRSLLAKYNPKGPDGR